MPRGQEHRYNYGKKFEHGSRSDPRRMVMYRYTNKKKSTKVMVDARTKKVIKDTRKY